MAGGSVAIYQSESERAGLPRHAFGVARNDNSRGLAARIVPQSNIVIARAAKQPVAIF